MIDLETDIPTSKGTIKLKHLKIGDKLFDEQGRICTITYLYPIGLPEKCHSITFDDGSVIKCSIFHSWFTWDKRARKAQSGPNPTIHPQFRATKEILDTIKTNHKVPETNHSIANTKPINLPKKNLLIDPYVLGCWLGDGQSSTGSIECAEEPILQEIIKAGYSVHQTKYSNNSKSKNYRIGNLVPNKTGNTNIGLLTQNLQNLNLINNKHIPSIYLQGSINQRLSLLQGLMDTDGTCSPSSNRCEYCTVLPALAQNVYELICSLGIKATLYKNESWLYNTRHQDRYRITFITKLPVFRLNRKLKNLKTSMAQDNRNTHRYITDVQPINSIPMRDITVNSSSNLYLTTSSFIPTGSIII